MVVSMVLYFRKMRFYMLDAFQDISDIVLKKVMKVENFLPVSFLSTKRIPKFN